MEIQNANYFHSILRFYEINGIQIVIESNEIWRFYTSDS